MENQSYTIGNILKKMVFDLFYEKIVSYVGFVVEHPHDSFSILRMSFINSVDDQYVFTILQDSCVKSIEYIQQILLLVEQNV